MRLFNVLKSWLSALSFRTGVVVLLMCVPFYVLSFLQFMLLIGIEVKGVLWIVLFGMAKLFQYAGIAILGVNGLSRIKAIFKKKGTTER